MSLYPPLSPPVIRAVEAVVAVVMHEARCDECGWAERHLLLEHARDAASAHAARCLARSRCGCCGRRVSLTVDDSGLCIACDLLLFPAPLAVPA